MDLFIYLFEGGLNSEISNKRTHDDECAYSITLLVHL